MIPQVDAVLRSLLAPTGASCRWDLPGDDWTGTPTVSLLLHEITEDLDARYVGWRDRRDGDGRVTGRQQPPRRYWLGYLLTVWAADAEAEHALMGAVLEALSAVETVPVEHLGAELAASGEIVQVSTAHPDSPSATPLWHALGIAPRPVLSVQVAAGMTHPSTPVADAPTDVDLGFAVAPPPAPSPPPTGRRPARRITEGAR